MSCIFLNSGTLIVIVHGGGGHRLGSPGSDGSVNRSADHWPTFKENSRPSVVIASMSYPLPLFFFHFHSPSVSLCSVIKINRSTDWGHPTPPEEQIIFFKFLNVPPLDVSTSPPPFLKTRKIKKINLKKFKFKEIQI